MKDHLTRMAISVEKVNNPTFRQTDRPIRHIRRIIRERREARIRSLLLQVLTAI
jgi:hypothetical protein